MGSARHPDRRTLPRRRAARFFLPQISPPEASPVRPPAPPLPEKS